MLIALGSEKGSPGVTTLALALAAGWPGRSMMVEADPSGGDLGIRLRKPSGSALPEVPTVLTLATAARSNRSAQVLNRYAQPVAETLSVVPGHLSSEQIAGVTDWEPLAAAMSDVDIPVLADCGRVAGTSPVLPILAAADLVVMVGRPDVSSLVHMRERINRLAPTLGAVRGKPVQLFPVLVTPQRHAAGDVADLCRVLAETPAGPLVVDAGFVAHDPGAVRRLEAGERPTGRLARTPLLRSVGGLVEQIQQLVGATPANSANGVRAGVRR